MSELLLGFRFGVFFYAAGVLPNPLDIRFQRVSGLSARLNTMSLVEGGQNIYKHALPETGEHENLVLERGLPVGSLLGLEFNVALTAFKFLPSNVLVTLFNESMVPTAAWMLFRAYPVRWETSGLDATEGKVVIETLELAYARLQVLRI
jgi:phage tail-like protein